jgi:hypothetical protein
MPRPEVASHFARTAQVHSPLAKGYYFAVWKRSPIMSNAHCVQQHSLGDDAGIVLFADPSVVRLADVSRQLGDLFSRRPDLSIIAAMGTRDQPGAGGMSGSRARFSAIVSALVDPPDPAGPFAMRRAAWDKVGPFRSVDAPLWDWLIRAAKAGEAIHPLETGSSRAEPALPRLAPARPPKERDWLRDHLESFEPAGRDSSPNSTIDAIAIRAGLFLWHDYLDEGHQLCQSIEGEGDGQSGDYWHAIMHRREPDYTNAKYWFRRLGAHPLFREMPNVVNSIPTTSAEAVLWRTRLLPAGGWNPVAFVDFCEVSARDEETDAAQFARRIQRTEMLLLLSASRNRLEG